jgi:hypothetical protein
MRVPWTEEEIRLLLSYYAKMKSGDMHKGHPLVIEASQAIRNLPSNIKYSKESTVFRNPNGVALKLANFLYLDPQYSGIGMKGCSELDRIIFNQVNRNSSFKNLIMAFLSALKNIGTKGERMGHQNDFYKLARQLNISYAGSKILPAESCYLNTSPIISFGLGRFTHVPWIVFTNYDQKVKSGIYPALLFYTEEQKVILTYCISESDDSNFDWNEHYIKDLPQIKDILPKTDKYLSSYAYKIYNIPNGSQEINSDELILNLEKVIEDFHEQFQNKNKNLIQNKEMTTDKYPFAFKNWFSSNNGGVRLPMNNKSGRPMGDKIIEGAIHHLIREMISDFKVQKGKFLCVLVGGPGNGKTDLMEFASEIFFKEFAIDPAVGKVALQTEFKLNNRKAKFKNQDVILNLIQDASQRDTGALSPLESLFNDFEELHVADNILTLICINRGVLENTLSKSRNALEPISKYKELIERIHSYNNLQSVIDDSKIWGDKISGVNLYTWSMDYDTLFKQNESFNANLIKEIIDKSECLVDFQKSSPLSPIGASLEFLSNNSKVFNLSRLLRHSEILNGKRFTYRELFSMMAYLFHHSVEEHSQYEQKLLDYERIPDYSYIERFNILYPLYQKSTSFRFFNYFLEPKKELVDNCIKPYLSNKSSLLRQLFETLSKIDSNVSEIPNFISTSGSSLFDPIFFEDNNFEFEDKNSEKVRLKKIIDKILYNQKIECENFSNILQPAEIELIKILENIKDSYCLSIDYDDFNATQLNGVDQLKTYLNNLIISIFKRSLLFNNFYIKDKELVQEYLELVQTDSSPFINVLQDSLTIQNKIENSLSTNIGQTAGELKNNIIEKSNIVYIESLPKPKNSMPSSDQIILTYSVRGHQKAEIIVITYNLFKSIKKNEKQIFTACLDKNYLLWQELKKIELANRSNANGGEIFIPDMSDKRIKVTRSPFKVELI